MAGMLPGLGAPEAWWCVWQACAVPSVVVIGAGIAGLAAAYDLRGDADVILIEATDQVGGKLRTSAVQGVDLDEGAEAMLARVPEGVALAEELGCPVVHPATASASIWLGDHLRPLPAGTMLGVPTSAGPVLRSRLLSPVGLVRAAADLVLPSRPLPADPSVGAYVRSRVGDQVVDRLVDPLLGGVYAGHADELSLRATVPQLVAASRGRSLLLGARAARVTPSDAPVFATVPAGLGTLAGVLADRCRQAGVEIQLGRRVRELLRTPTGWSIDGLAADAVILAVPGIAARRLLQPHAPLAAEQLAEIPYASVALATFAYRAADVTGLPAGSGFLVPAQQGRVIKAATFSSRKWSHLDRDGLVFIRASAGRAGDERDLQRDDVELAGVLAAELAEATGMRAKPIDTRLTRWGGALPQYLPGHLERVAGIRSGLPAGLAVCGAAYDGVGIPACIRSGRAAAASARASIAGAVTPAADR
jgi:oxygen-dependent protoporphyrinogen oxidase